MSDSPVLSLRDVDVFYGEVQALFGVSLDVYEGEIVSIIGSNGAGKSTAMRSIMGLRIPRNGTITFRGTDITKMRAHSVVGHGIVYVPEGRLVFPDLSVQVNLEMGAYSQNFSRKQMNEHLEAQYALFPRLKERRNQMAGSLSGGEQQMLAMSRALMSHPKLLMLDEPSMGLAPILVDQIFEIIKELHATGTTILLVEQNATKALQIADRAYVLETGKITLSGTGTELAQSDEVRKAYLGG